MERCPIKVLTYGCALPHIKLPSASVNVFLIEVGGKRILVDAGAPVAGPVLANQLSTSGWVPDLIVITHAHIDHVGGARAIQRRFPSARLLADPRDVETIEQGQIHVPTHINPWTKIRPVINWAWTRRPMPAARVDGDLTELESLGIELLYTPGHSFPHHSLILPDEQIIAGDALTVGFRGDPQLNVYYDDYDEQLKSLFLLAKRAKGMVFAGHGPCCSPERLSQFAEKLQKKLVQAPA